MTSNLKELKEALYEDFDTARANAETLTGNAEYRKAAAGFMQAAAKTAEVIVAIEQGEALSRKLAEMDPQLKEAFDAVINAIPLSSATDKKAAAASAAAKIAQARLGAAPQTQPGSANRIIKNAP